MRKLSFAAAIVMALSGAGLATSASAAPGAPMGVTAGDTVSPVMHRGGMHRHGMMRHRHMHRHHMMHHRMMRHRMMHHRRMHRM